MTVDPGIGLPDLIEQPPTEEPPPAGDPEHFPGEEVSDDPPVTSPSMSAAMAEEES